jgi:predicted CXXCH cytochrome family protein
LGCHHPDYSTLGFEEVTDLVALCRGCHRAMPS